MRAPLQWLAEYCDPGLGARELGERLAMTGTEVDRILQHGVGNLDAFVVGRVLETSRHPDADRLTVCVVQLAGGEQTQIVCGAPNVAAGQTVAIARPGAIMPDGTKLKKAKLRGVSSDGMILAEDELAISSEHDSTIELDSGSAGARTAQAAASSPARRWPGCCRSPPRCSSSRSPRTAPTASASTASPARCTPRPARGCSARRGTTILAREGAVGGAEIVVEATDLCPRFTARAFENVTIAPSPMWLKARLTAAGQRPINNVVDITNYAMLLTGQPLHAFDLDRIAGAKLVVRRARDGEQVVTLDGQTRTLDCDVCLIADADGPTSIAGVMGGTRSEVQPDTTRVLMEVASWDGPNIHATSAKLGLRSEASARFEKGLSVEQAMEAQIVATKLMLELTGATLVPGTIDIGGAGPEPQVIRLREKRLVGLLGVNITRSESALHLQRLGFETAERPDGLDVTVPHWRRNDVSREADLIEEVARLHGLDDLPATLPSRRGAVGVLTPAQRLRRRAEDALVGRGLLEIVGWSFDSARARRPPAPAGRRPAPAPRRDREPDEQRSVGAAHDAARLAARRRRPQRRARPGRARDLRVRRRLPRDRLSSCRTSTARSARSCPATSSPPRAYLEAVLSALRVDASFAAAAQPFLHPGRSAEVRAGGEIVGWVGDVHPLVAGKWDLEQIAAFEIDLDRVIACADSVARYEDLTSFPELREDIAIVVDEGVPGGDRARDRACRRRQAARARVEVFDVYRGEQVAPGRASLAIALTFRASDRTLTDADVAPLREKIVARLATELGGELRGQ